MKNKIDQALGLRYNPHTPDNNDIWIERSIVLRRLIGILGMLLPVLLFLTLYIRDGLTEPLDSISHYYYTRANGVFIITVSLLAIFLIIYKGKETGDFYISLLAGLCALALLLFPTTCLSEPCLDEKSHFITFLSKNETREKFHLVVSGVFLLCLAYISAFIFTRQTDRHTPQIKSRKKTRNFIYWICAIVMLLALLTLVYCFYTWTREQIEKTNIVFWMEVVALEAFGISWFIKGETLFKDIVTPAATANQG